MDLFFDLDGGRRPAGGLVRVTDRALGGIAMAALVGMRNRCDLLWRRSGHQKTRIYSVTKDRVSLARTLPTAPPVLSKEAVADDAGLLDEVWIRIARMRLTLAVDDGEACLTLISANPRPWGNRQP